MPETESPYVRMSRVTTRRGTLRQLNCPLEPELLVAEFANELPPDVAQAVREHMAVCETCGANAQALRTPYALLTSLGSEPVPYVPDLREPVRAKAASSERFQRPLRALLTMGRFGFVTVLIGAVVIVALAITVGNVANSLGVFTVSRTTNQLTNVPAAAKQGQVFAETSKLVTVSDNQGRSWQVAEVVATDQRSGKVLHSLPASNATLHTGPSSNLPVSIVINGDTVYELTGRQNQGQQALIAFNSTTGAVRSITPLTLPNGRALAQDVSAVSLALAPDGTTAYIGLSGADDALASQRVLTLSTKTGRVASVITPAIPTQVPLPPPAGSLPASAFPSVIPTLDVSAMRITEAAGGAIAVSPDGQALFDVLMATDSKGIQYAVVRRISLANGQIVALGIPGPFHALQLAISPSLSSPQVYLVSGSPQANVYVVDASAQGPSLLGQIALGGPAAPTSIHLNDRISVSVAANGGRLYIAQDASSSDGVISGHSRWLIDTLGMGIIASASDPTSAGDLVANTSPGGKTFMLTGGQITIGAPDLSSGWTPWLRANDGASILKIVGVEP